MQRGVLDVIIINQLTLIFSLFFSLVFIPVSRSTVRGIQIPRYFACCFSHVGENKDVNVGQTRVPLCFFSS